MLSPKRSFWMHPLVTRLSIFLFMILVGVSMAANIQAKNTVGLILSFVSLAAGVYVIHLLQKLRESSEQEETN